MLNGKFSKLALRELVVVKLSVCYTGLCVYWPHSISHSSSTLGLSPLEGRKEEKEGRKKKGEKKEEMKERRREKGRTVTPEVKVIDLLTNKTLAPM